jgi:hypothetical protein
MRSLAKLVVFGIICVLLISGSNCWADTIWDYEAVNSIGFGIHPKVNADYTNPENRVVVEGIALAGVDEILNPNSAYTVFIQDDTSDRGGIQAWAGSWFYGALWSYYRSTAYIDFQAGDRLRITGFLADAGRGKVVVNHRHSAVPELVFYVEVLGHPGMPDPELIPSISLCNYFDATREGGGERYQTRYVMLHGVDITEGTWGNNQLLTISDQTGSVGMLLSGMGDFSSNPCPQGKLNVVGIFDQEDTTSPYTEGYRVWVKKYKDIAIALDNCRAVRTYGEGTRVALVRKVVSRVYNGFFYVQDEGRSGGIKVVSSRQLSPGSVVAIQGIVATDGEEKFVDVSDGYISVLGTQNVKPLYVTGRDLCSKSGLTLDGLLVVVAGRVGDYLGNGIYELYADSGNRILIGAGSLTLPSRNTMVLLTGVAKVCGGNPVILLANDSDIQIVN